MTPQQQKWVDALRSGKFKQGLYALNNGDRYCCLGVACEILKDELGITKIDGIPVTYDGSRSEAPEKVTRYLGLHSAIGAHELGETSLAQLNDCGYSFKEIADAIETGAYFRPTEMG